MFLAIVAFLIIFSLVILLHEFGHFIFAKRNGVDVEEFGVGYPPKIWGKKIGKTLYSINLIPFGGFVKIPGSEYEEESAKLKNGFASKSTFIKFKILFGGIFMNFCLAVAIYYAFFIFRGFVSLPLFLMDDFHFRFGNPVIENNVVLFANPKSEFKSGDKIVSVSTAKGEKSTPKNTQEMIGFIADKKDVDLSFVVRNVQTQKQGEVTAKTYYDESLKRYVVGIGLGESVTLEYKSLVEKILSPFLHSYNVLSYSFAMFGDIFASSVKEKDAGAVAQTLTGPVGIFFIVEEILKVGGVSAFWALVDFTALLSLSLAIMNILPLPALDGGHLSFVLYEVIFKKTPPLKFMRKVSSFGMIFLISLAVLVAFKDLWMFGR